MTTCADIITGACRKLGLVAPSGSLTAEQADRGIEGLQALYDELIGKGTLATLTDVYLEDTTYDAGENERIFATAIGTTTINLAEGLVDDVTGEHRTVRDGSVVVISELNSDTRATYVFDGHTGKWTSLLDLSASTNAPFATRFKSALEAMLALELADVFHVPVPARVQQQAAMGRLAMASRHVGERQPINPEFF
jgi:hypothetical protein